MKSPPKPKEPPVVTLGTCQGFQCIVRTICFHDRAYAQALYQHIALLASICHGQSLYST